MVDQNLNQINGFTHGFQCAYIKSQCLFNFVCLHGLVWQREYFPFLDDFSHSQNRTTFYFTLGRLLFMEDSPVKFKVSMESIQQVRVWIHFQLLMFNLT